MRNRVRGEGSDTPRGTESREGRGAMVDDEELVGLVISLGCWEGKAGGEKGIRGWPM